MTIELIVIGKTDSKEIAALVELYARRVNHYCRFAVTALPDVRNTKSMTVDSSARPKARPSCASLPTATT